MDIPFYPIINYQLSIIHFSCFHHSLHISSVSSPSHICCFFYFSPIFKGPDGHPFLPHYQLSIINYQLSIINYPLSIIHFSCFHHSLHISSGSAPYLIFIPEKHSKYLNSKVFSVFRHFHFLDCRNKESQNI